MGLPQFWYTSHLDMPTRTKKSPTLLAIDGHNFLWRANSTSFKKYSAKGTPTHVTNTFLSLYQRAHNFIEDHTVTHCVVVFDPKGPTDNHALLDTYKANRVHEFEDEQDSPYYHIPFIKKALKFLNIKVLERKKCEADDVISTITTRFTSEHPDGTAYIASTDSDFYQLLSPRVRQVVPGREGIWRMMDHAKLFSTYGVEPHEYVYFKSLVGDSADNIKGVPKIGRVGARAIIRKEREFDLAPFTDILALNQKLITLNSALPLQCAWQQYAVKPAKAKFSASDIFKKLKL